MTTFDEHYLRPRDIAETLGVHRTTVYKMIKEGELPHVKIGKAVRVPARAFEVYKQRLETIHGEDAVVSAEPSADVESEIESRLAGFKDRTGLDPFEFVDRWRAGEIDDTTENAELAIDALALRAVIQRRPALV